MSFTTLFMGSSHTELDF